MMSTVNDYNNIYIYIIILVLTDGEEERPHQSEMVASDERQHDFPRPTGQSQEVDPTWRHWFHFVFFCWCEVIKRFTCGRPNDDRRVFEYKDDGFNTCNYYFNRSDRIR